MYTFRNIPLVLSFLFTATLGQQAGILVTETHPKLTWQTCTNAGCSNVMGLVTLDANWRWLHATNGQVNCFTGNTWDATLCPDPVTCSQNCALDGADYAGTYGITTTSNALTLRFITTAQQMNVGSRVYFMASDTTYQIFKPLNQEFAFDVDVSNLPCGVKGALYFVQMDADGGLAKFPHNKAGAKFGTGYCDSKCPRDVKFINGQANVAGWVPSPNDTSSGTGNLGSCCTEMDVWEANSVSAAFTAHSCQVGSQTLCTGQACGGPDPHAGVCDPDGCDFNSFRMGNQAFYGGGLAIDTSRVFTVVTQFITADNTATGALQEIRRFYVQNGKTIPNSMTNIPGISTIGSITDLFCVSQKSVFGDVNSFTNEGGLTAVGQALQKGVVLAMTIRDDHMNQMLWLDSNFPSTADPTKPGISRGTCSTSSGIPSDVEANFASASVTFSNIRFGNIGSTVGGTPTTTTPGPTCPTIPVPAALETKFGQCGGTGWTGPTICVAGSTCTVLNSFFSQCI